MEITTVSEILKQYGPTGVSVVLMGSGLIYLVGWLRLLQDKMNTQLMEMQASAQAQQEKVRGEFIETLKEKRADYQKAMETERNDFLAAIKEQREEHRSTTQSMLAKFDVVIGKFETMYNGLEAKVEMLATEVRGLKR